MSEKTPFPQWRDLRGHTKIPFADTATVPDNLGSVFVDAAIYLPGNREQAWLSAIEVTDTLAIVTVSNRGATASGSIARGAPTSSINLSDASGRPAGVLVGADDGIPALFSLKYGKSAYTATQTLFAAGVVYPLPFDGVLSLNGLSGAVPVIGEHGVRLGLDGRYIKVDVVGVRSAAARGVTGLRTISGVTPDVRGAFKFVSSRRLASDSILRITTDESRITFSLVRTKE